MKVLKNGTPILAQASMTSFWWPIAASRTSRIGVHRVRVEAEAADRQPVAGDLGDDLARPLLGQVGDVDVARPRVAPGGALRRRPAGDLEALEGVRAGPLGNVAEWRVRERRRQEAELHPAVSPPAACIGVGAGASRSTRVQRPSRALAATASPTSISSWPSANVG